MAHYKDVYDKQQGKHCIAGVVCNDLGICYDDWKMYKEIIREEIRIKQTNSSSVMKREYISKLQQKL